MPEDETTPTEPVETPAPEGEEAPTEDGTTEDAAAPELPADLESADEAELLALRETLDEAYTARRQSATTQAHLDELRTIRERQNAISSELQRRRDEAAQVAEQLAALDQEEPAPVPAMANVTARQAAAARGRQPAVAQTPPAPAPARPRVAMLAAAGTEHIGSGEEMSMGQLGSAFDRAKRGPDGRVVLASLPAFEDMPEFRADCLSVDNGTPRNDELIAEAVADWRLRRSGQGALARMAAICDPLEPIREIPSAFTAAEPVAAIFPSRPMGRLGFQFTPSITLAGVASGVTLWDEADQAAVVVTDQGTWKPCVDVACPPVSSVRAEFVPGCLRFDITTEMSNPARITNATEALNAVRARTKEGRILQLIDLNSSKFRYTGDYGALPSLIEALNTAIAQAVFTNRLEDPSYTLLLPPAVVAILTIDRANRAYGREEEAIGDVLTYLRSSVDGLGEIVRTLDASLGGEPGLPFPAFPASTAAGGPAGLTDLPYIEGGDYRIRLVDPSGWIYASTGEMNAGVTRDSNQLRQNKAQFFVEDAALLAKHGPQSDITIDMVLCADGSRAGLIEPDSCATS